MKDKDEPAKPTMTFERYRIPQWTYEALGKPTKGMPKDYNFILNNLLTFADEPLAARGGKVICTITEGNLTGIGVAVCSYSDVFKRKIGYDIAKTRAERALDLVKQLDLPDYSTRKYQVTITPQ